MDLSLKDVGERKFLKFLLPQLISLTPNRFVVPPGDDAAVLRAPPGLVLSIDGLTQGTHFQWSWSHGFLKRWGFSLGRALGWKLMGSCLSDLAAMGEVKHRWAMIYMGAPGNLSMDFISNLFLGIKETAVRYNCALVGGDTVRANELSLVAAVGGQMDQKRVLSRTGARVGDLLCIAGTVGDGAVGLNILEEKKEALSRKDQCYFVKRFFQHLPLLEEARQLARGGGVTSLMDLSDSLVGSISILTEASGVGAEVNVNHIPVSKTYQKYFKPGSSLITRGEDYALLFSLRSQDSKPLSKKISFRVIGEIKPAAYGIEYRLDGQRFDPPASFEHFT